MRYAKIKSEKGRERRERKKIRKGKVDIDIYIDGQIDRCKYIVRNREREM